MVEDNEKDVIEIAVIMGLFCDDGPRFWGQPVYTIVQYPVSELDITGICMKMSLKKNRPVKKQNYPLRFARAKVLLSTPPLYSTRGERSSRQWDELKGPRISPR